MLTTPGLNRSPPGPGRDELGVEREQHALHVGGGVAMTGGATDRPAVAHLRVADLARGVGDNPAEVAGGDIGVPAEGADRDRVTVFPDVAEL